MKEIKITDALEAEINTIINLGEQVVSLKTRNKKLWELVKSHFNLGDYSNENLKSRDILEIRLLAELLAARDIKEQKVEKEIK